jgi:hypothetical protein
MDDVLRLAELTKQLDVSVRQLRHSGQELAQAEMEYKIKLRETALKMKDGGDSATFIGLTIYGEPNVARLRFKRDVAQAVYLANQESINSCKLQMRLLEDQIARDWGMQK